MNSASKPLNSASPPLICASKPLNSASPTLICASKPLNSGPTPLSCESRPYSCEMCVQTLDCASKLWIVRPQLWTVSPNSKRMSHECDRTHVAESFEDT